MRLISRRFVGDYDITISIPTPLVGMESVESSNTLIWGMWVMWGGDYNLEITLRLTNS
jgi:hypothetical protein